VSATLSNTLAEALVAAQADMPKVEADAVNPHFKSRFVSLDHLIAKTRPVLNKHGLNISQWPSFVNTGPGDVTPTLVTRISHVSGEAYEQAMPLLVAGADMQKLGAALTYARRYAWAAALGISEQEDDDGNAASAKPQSGPKVSEKEKTPATAPETDALMARLVALSVEYKALVPEYDVTVVRAKATEQIGKPGYKAWLEKQITTFEANIKAKQPAKFEVPAKAKAAA